ncbi:hypothetical protein DLD82_05840 [Methanospirillum stamsii]|uniref:Uncharacterized protein n=1 Tax=Methanospirillum stamsii TaxID=1277351 RepID=A0A2V2NIZ8_9EURY|nr:hypothetical protein DLD82_05840 [Methanospirillum stamsii]
MGHTQKQYEVCTKGRVKTAESEISIASGFLIRKPATLKGQYNIHLFDYSACSLHDPRMFDSQYQKAHEQESFVH